jgi:hypothetical protein
MSRRKEYSIMPPHDRTRHQALFAQTLSLDENCVLIRAGEANGFSFSADLLARAAPLFEGAPCYADHSGLTDWGRQGGRSIRDLVGVFEGAQFNLATQEVRACLTLRQDAQWLRSLIKDFGERPQLFGLSADLWIIHDGPQVEAIERVNSVDIVVNPAAGGRFLNPQQSQFAQAQDAQNTEPQEDPMSDAIISHVQQTTDPNAAPAPGAQPLEAKIVELTLAQSGLPEPLQRELRLLLDNGTIGLLQLDEQVGRLRDVWAQTLAPYTIKGLGAVTQMQTPLDRIELAFENLMGLPQEQGRASHDVARLSGVREMYDLLTGDWERYGTFRGDRVRLANATTSSMAEIVRNVLNKVMLRAYEQRPFWWKAVVREEDLPTMNTARWITVGGFTDLDTVSEGGAYTEKTWDDAAETSSFVKKGNYLGITLEMIDRDDVQAIRALPRRLGHAANRTLSAAVAALFTDNSGTGPALTDSYNLFDAANHGNLLTTALSAAEWQVVTAAMFKQSEYHSAKRLGVRPSFCLVPIDLEKTALEIFTSDVVPAANSLYRNVLQRSADAVVVVPEWTDTNNWAAAAHPNDLEGVCVGYRYGRAPELFIAGDELMGSMFTNDELRIKVRFIYTVGIGDYRALHKSNVA